MYKFELELAKNAVIQAGKALKEQNEAEVEVLEGKDIKLVMDRTSEAIIINYLKNSNIPILSEEQGFYYGSKECMNKGMLWIIDPLDGSANYWKNMRELACVSIALWKDGKPALGVIYRFECDELFVGVVGEGAWLNDKPITTSITEKLSEAVLATGFPLKRSYDSVSLSRFVKQIQNFKKIRMLGAAAIMGAFVACGRVDAYMEESIMFWDIAASSAIVVAAGGVAEMEVQGEFQCICRLFANENLKTEVYEKCIRG